MNKSNSSYLVSFLDVSDNFTSSLTHLKKGKNKGTQQEEEEQEEEKEEEENAKRTEQKQKKMQKKRKFQ